MLLLVLGLYPWNQKIPTSQNNKPTNTPLGKPAITEKDNQLSPHSPEASIDFLQKRAQLTQDLLSLRYCTDTHTCPKDDSDSNSDPRAASILLGKIISEKLIAYGELHQKENYFDDKSKQMVETFINYPNGFVQEATIHLMSMQPPKDSTGLALIGALKDSFDAKIINQSLKELIRYPSLEKEVQDLLQQSLQTGSFFAAREIAAQIFPFLNDRNIESYIKLLEKLPPRSKRARLLKANITEFQKR